MFIPAHKFCSIRGERSQQITFALIRIAYICLFAFCCSGAFANTHQIGVSDSHLDFARSQRALPAPDILRYRALPPAEPFVLPSSNFPTGEIRAKWGDLVARISADEKLLATCRSDQSKCSQAESLFLSIVELAGKHEGRARLGWLNRAINMSIKPVSDWVQYGDVDYWASPLQTLGSGSGDCEDYAIVKYVALRALGVEAHNLRLVIVQYDKRQTQHAVLAVRYEQEWLILDNLTMAMIAVEDARNYRPLFTLDSSRGGAVVAAERARTKIG